MEHESLEMETDETQISKIQDENKRRAAERRSLETADERERRLESNRIRIARKRATETEFEREQRLTSLRKKLAEKRSKETQEQRERRLETNRKRIADRRSDTNKEAWSLQNWVGGSFNAPEVVSTSMAANTTNQHTAVMSSVDTAKDTSQATITPQVNGASKIIVTETKPGRSKHQFLCECVLIDAPFSVKFR